MKKGFAAGSIIFLLFFSPSVFSQAPSVMVLGVAQDGGYPHAGCEKECCSEAWKTDSLKRFVVSLALLDPSSKKWWLFEAGPDFKEQLHYFRTLTKNTYNDLPEGIFITHAHIGHYTGLMHLGREVMNSKEVPVYVLPALKHFLEENGPWSQLVKLKNITLIALDTNKTIELNKNILISTFVVPHRDEFSETAGFKITAGEKKYLFIPDIDKWQKWPKNILEEVNKVNIAFLDGTFNEINELKNRNISEVPHPLVSETIKLFNTQNPPTKAKVHFIHFNHSNKILWDQNTRQKIKEQGFNLAQQGNSY
ncbi:MAG TPA: MBL fold metallo-hydrolase [Bacteroidia bacterium]|nr:MBL fold metallo-hydrolase [Bacteroidia bacterium]